MDVTFFGGKDFQNVERLGLTLKFLKLLFNFGILNVVKNQVKYDLKITRKVLQIALTFVD